MIGTQQTPHPQMKWGKWLFPPTSFGGKKSASEQRQALYVVFPPYKHTPTGLAHFFLHWIFLLDGKLIRLEVGKQECLRTEEDKLYVEALSISPPPPDHFATPKGNPAEECSGFFCLVASSLGRWVEAAQTMFLWVSHGKRYPLEPAPGWKLACGQWKWAAG